MKIKSIHSIIALLLLIIMMFTSCNASMADGGGMAGGAPMAGGSYEPGASIESSSDSDTGVGESESSTSNSGSQNLAGLITAAAWNDNDNYDAFKKLFYQDGDKIGKFFAFSKEGDAWGFASGALNRIKVSVFDTEDPVAGAEVCAYDDGGKLLYRAVTDASGVAYIFTDIENGKVKITSGEHTAESEFSKDSRDLIIRLDASEEKKNIIDIMFVIDITGSMGDELTFLQTEIDDVIERVVAKNEGTQVNLALLFYRDKVDKEEFAYFDFVNVTDPAGLKAQKAALNSQQASGGGDYPESVDEALELAMSKQWSSGATTKLIFHLLDAPPHSGTEDAKRYNAAVMSAAEQGIRICPILCSGSDTLTEYLTRQAAVHTGGTFIFVTDDSGIGNSHHDPDLPNVTVEALNMILVRIISGYHSGIFDPAVSYKQAN